MSGLVPEKRMDKTGKLVTRHIKYDNKVPAPKSSFPSVFSMFRGDDKFPGETRETIEYPTRMIHGSQKKKLMRTLNDDTMRALYSMGVGAAHSERLSTLEEDFRAVVSECREEGSFALLNNIAFFSKDDGRDEDARTLQKFIGFVKGLSQYQEPGTPRIDYTKASEEELEEARKMLRVAKVLTDEFNDDVASQYDRHSGKGNGVFIKYRAAIEAFRGMEKDEALEFADFVNKTDSWLDTEENVDSALDLFHLRGETHDALDEGVL